LAFDYIILNNRPITHEQESIYASEGAVQIGVHGSISGSAIEGVTIIYDNLLSEGDMVRHDPARLAGCVLSCAANH
jgi:hypothetical protein